ncbi:MAG: PIG-L deacetylase family protein [Steroidobacteraceae bacterium]
MNVLIVVAHPDDEVLGCGATGAALAASGRSVKACFLSAHAEARGGRPAGSELLADTRRAQAKLGFGEPYFGEFPNMRLNTVPHIELVRFIENAIVASGAQVIFTHHPVDLNDDHVQTARACMAAARLFQRRGDVPPLRRLYLMEVLSSTDWAFTTASGGFRADTFIEATAWMDTKLAALREYRGVMREYPHSRSEQTLLGLAACRGSEAGLNLAESFQTAFAAGSVPGDVL